MKTEYLETILQLKKLLEGVYNFCDNIQPERMTMQEKDGEEKVISMSLRALLNKELLRLTAYIVGQDRNAAQEAVDVMSVALDRSFTADEIIREDQENKQDGTYDKIPLNFAISNDPNSETVAMVTGFLMPLFENYGKLIAIYTGKIVSLDGDCSLVTDYIDRLRICFGVEAEAETDAGKCEETGAGDCADTATEAEDELDEPEKLEDLLAELDSLVGLENVKEEVRTMTNIVRIGKLRESRGLKQTESSLHMVFSGNPGTGKTTVARLVARIYRALGVLSKGHLVETDRSDLVAGYVGQTAIKTSEVIQKAMGGVLFIDEAYALTNKGSETDFGQEAIETILKEMEDNRGDFIVIAAGYTELMEKFLSSNPGLRSRFSKTLFFADYNAEQMFAIFEGLCQKAGMSITDDAGEKMREYFRNLYDNRDENFANARDVRNAFEKILANQSNRLAASADNDLTDAMLQEITLADVRI